MALKDIPPSVQGVNMNSIVTPHKGVSGLGVPTEPNTPALEYQLEGQGPIHPVIMKAAPVIPTY